MAKNWIEELVSEFYKLDDYIVITDLDLPMPKTEYRRIKGHSDIDVLAIKNNEIIHTECKSWWGTEKKNEEEELRGLKDRFDVAGNLLFQKYDFLKNIFQTQPKITKIFVTSGKPQKMPRDKNKSPWYRLETFCEKEKIQLLEINTVIKELIKKIKRKYPTPSRVGKEESNITRFLIQLIHNDFLK